MELDCQSIGPPSRLDYPLDDNPNEFGYNFC